jgi:hypothetical protein
MLDRQFGNRIKHIENAIAPDGRTPTAVSRKKTPRRIPPLPRRPPFRATDNKTELLLALLRDAAKSSQGPEPQLFYPLREVARRFRIPLSLGARLYRELEREHILRPIRGSGTLLEGLNGARKTRVKGIVAIAASLSRFVIQQDYRTFVIVMGRELGRRELAAVETFYASDATASDLVDRLKECHPDKVIWYRPPKLFREVVPRLHDIGLPIVGVNDGGFPRACCQYEIRREVALTRIVKEWKNEGLTLVKVAVGPTRSTIAEERIGRVMEELDVGIKFVSLDSHSLRHFVDFLARGSNFGIVILNSAASFLAMGAPDALSGLSKRCRLALVDGPVSVLSAKLSGATVDLVMIDWRALTKRIADDLTAPPCRVGDQPLVFEASALCRVPLSSYSQSL